MTITKNFYFSGWYKSYEKQHKEQTMWSMWDIRFSVDNHLFTVFPYFNKVYPDVATALAYCRKEKGVHTSSTSTQKHKEMMKIWSDNYIKFTPDLKRFHCNGSKAT